MAVYARIKFCRVLYQILTMLLQRKEEQQQQPSAGIGVDCQRMLTTALDMLFVMQKTVHLGISADNSKYCICL